ncbi:TylF/MycF family methyltransferase [Candidatus Frankia alpina]|uniref:Macrocin O-methyltransferase n=1 Tax=Candidatus Frankia alpina TaxID=2699483 RepID=A0A4S5EUP3_9ACTN|nr:TylF/MycF family methyltransferase [Candidatus Frankia alpina]THJ75912.1 macrocin O-methyltransferase [Candidatus Frankia alpina]
MTTTSTVATDDLPDTTRRYLDLLRSALTCSLWDGGDGSLWEPRGGAKRVVARAVRRTGMEIVKRATPQDRRDGLDWPRLAHTMTGERRMRNLQECTERVILDGVAGDLIETGAWRGGACILMRGVLAAYGVTDRTVWVADSFEGLPAPDSERYAADAGDRQHEFTELAVSVEQVRANFHRFGLLDDQVRFLQGWFRDTLPTAPIDRLAVLRLDGDMYESTTEALTALYPKLSDGGFCIVDDYGAVPGCRTAVEDYRAAHRVTDPITGIDWTGIYWRKHAPSTSA